MAWTRGGIVGVALGAALLAPVPLAPAGPQEQHCMPLSPDDIGRLTRCLVQWTGDFVGSGGQDPGYTCSNIG
ncbi:MAG TPA: hypothetical protein VEU29_08365 [Actinomycetota bacterium]|nr:hypothetical protein [Actinomycetota bacterium]